LIQRGRSLANGNRSSDRSAVAFLRWLEGNEAYLPVTFDQKIALERRDLPFVTPLHVLAKLAALDQKAAGPFVSRLRARDDTLRQGLFLFVCELWEVIGAHRDTRLLAFAWDVQRKNLAPEVSMNLIKVLSRAVDPSSPFNHVSSIQEGLFALDNASRESRLAEIETLRRQNEVLIARKLASLDVYDRNRLARIDAELQQATDDKIIRMKAAERSRVQSDYEEKRREIETGRNADIVSKRIAAGLLEISRGH